MAQNYDLQNTGHEVQERLEQVMPNKTDIEKEVLDRQEVDNYLQEQINTINAEIGEQGGGSETINGRLDTLEEAVGTGGSVDERIAAAEEQILGGASEDYNTLGKVEGELEDTYRKEETYTKQQVNDLITTPDVQYVSVVATDQTTAVTDLLPATGADDTIYRIGNWDGTQYDATMYALYAWNGSAYVCLAVRSFVGEVYDISANHPDGQGNPTPYADLTSALAYVPVDIRAGGMSVKFIRGNAQSSDNKYVQYRYIGTATTGTPNPFLDEANWQGVVDEILPNSPDIPTIGALFKSLIFPNSVSSLILNGGKLIENTFAHISSLTSQYDGMRVSDDYDSCCVVIQDGSDYLIVKNNTPLRFVFFSDIDTDVDNYISANVIGTVPTNAKFCVINFAKADNVSGYANLRVEQRKYAVYSNELKDNIFGLVKSVNSEIGATLNVDLDSAVHHNGWLGSNNIWGNVTSNIGNHVTLDRGFYSKISVKAKSSQNAFIAFYTYMFAEPTVNSEDSSPYLCSGETRRTITSGTTAVIDIPNDCKYIYVGISSSVDNPNNYKPLNVTLGQVGDLRNRVSNAESDIEEIQDEINDVGETLVIDINSTEELHNGWFGSGGLWNNVTGTNIGVHLTIPSDTYRKFKIKGTISSGYSSYFFFAKANYVEPTANLESYIPYLCEGQTGRITVPYNTEVVYDIPEDCAYIVIGRAAVTGQAPYKPQSASLFTKSGILERIESLESNDNTNRTIKLLAIGNSFALDCLSYVPMILRNIKPNINVTIGILYKGSCSLQEHWENRADDDFYPYMSIYETESGVWRNVANVGLDYGLAYTDWDIITLQQNSSNSNKYNTYQPYLNNLIGYIATKCQNYKIGWILTHSYSDDYSQEWTSEQMAAGIRTAAQHVMNETAVDILLPYGTAIQNARTNQILNALGFGGLCYNDHIHLNDGLGRQIAAYLCTKVLLEHLSKKDINGNRIIVDNSFLTTYNVPTVSVEGVEIDAIGSTPENCVLAQKAASLALKKPFETSDI